jgi:predicted flap endonuclease-1-like 5' DNA nuclease
MVRLLTVLAGLIFAFTGVLFLAWLLWLLWKRLEQETQTVAIEIKKTVPASIPEEPVTEAEPGLEAPSPDLEPTEVTTRAVDDLKRIEGIGPKISSVLQESAGISTFAQLASTSVDQLWQILEETDPRLLRLVDPTTWPEQAALAAGGEWDAFEALLAELKAGRRR